jgi:hypothetical protein
MKAILIKREDGYNLGIEQPQGRLLEATCSPSQQLILDKSGASTKYKLSKQNCDEIFGVVDVERLAEYSVQEVKESNADFYLRDVYKEFFIEGFNKAMELNKDKQFTLEDIRIAIVYGEKHRDMDAGKIPYQPFFEFLSSLQKPTEIEVEIEMERVVIETKVIGAVKGVKGSGHKTTTYKSVPKLGSDGCLILRKL